MTDLFSDAARDRIDEVVGTQGTPVELLGSLIGKKLYPELWRARNELTHLSNQED